MILRGRGGALHIALNYISFCVSASFFVLPFVIGKRFSAIFVYGVSPIIQAIPAIFAKYILRVPLFIWVQDLWPKSLELTGFVKSRAILSFVGMVTRWIYRRATLLLVPSHSFVEEVRRDGHPTPVDYLPNPAEVAQSVSEPAFQLPAAFNVVFAGNIGKAQALDVALSAARLLQDDNQIGIVLVGSGSASSSLEARARVEGLGNVHFLGRFPPEAMPAIYAAADALLVSLVRDDALSVVLPSKVPTYLAAAKPIIAALSGEGARVIEESGAGLVVPQEDASELANAIRQIKALSHEERQTLALNGKKYFEENYQLSSIIIQLLDKIEHTTQGLRARS